MRDYPGCIHIHTSYSDGFSRADKIIKAANESGLSYLIITDHNTLRHKTEGAEGWRDNVLVLVGEEISPRRKNHYLALGIEKEIGPKRVPQRYIDEVNRQDGLGFIVHPHVKWNPLLPFIINKPWKDWDVNGYTGIEIWSYMHDWIAPVNIFNLIYYCIYPERAISGPQEETLNRWDSALQKRRAVAIGGIDAHAPFFSYGRLFKTIRTHLLMEEFTRDFQQDKLALYNALKAGHSFIGYDEIFPSSGFNFSLRTKDSYYIMGDEAALDGEAVLYAESPTRASLSVVRNGAKILEKETATLELKIDRPGVYRVEARLNGQPWVFTNPIYLREGSK